MSVTPHRSHAGHLEAISSVVQAHWVTVTIVCDGQAHGGGKVGRQGLVARVHALSGECY